MFKSNDKTSISVSKLVFLRYFKSMGKKFAFIVGQN
jgi:hypothetical protein